MIFTEEDQVYLWNIKKLALFRACSAYGVKIRFLMHFRMYRFSRKNRIETDQPAIEIADQSATGNELNTDR